MHLQLRGQQLKTIIYIHIYIDSYMKTLGKLQTKNLKIDTHTNKKNQLKYNTKDSHQTRRGENK